MKSKWKSSNLKYLKKFSKIMIFHFLTKNHEKGGYLKNATNKIPPSSIKLPLKSSILSEKLIPGQNLGDSPPLNRESEKINILF